MQRVVKSLRCGASSRGGKHHGCVCRYYGVERESLFVTRRGEFNEPRSTAIYLMRKLRRDRLIDIGQYFEIDSYSTVSSIVERFKIRMNDEPLVKKRLAEVTEAIRMGQGQT